MTMIQSRNYISLILILLLLGPMLSSCKKTGVRVYTAPKETLTSQGVVNNGSNTAQIDITWNAPSHWQEQQSNAIRLGSYRIYGLNNQVADVTIVSFPGKVGGLLANVNRWRGQLGLPAIFEEGLASLVESKKINGDTVTVVQLSSKDMGKQMVVGIFEFNNKRYFFKLMGDASVVSEEKKGFLKMLETVRLK
ncbi:hypothetical protein DID77_04020 [Candidatus Marinamargulisbacteria bacterium SCGC AG-439-L15]|nr:hypothetical protein DID77_04020 [Candidatus Marinamargulisbacteria bacterium SCGC AG-439-L15]